MTKLEKDMRSTESDIPHEVRRLRLLAAALDLQHYTSTESNIVHIPGGDRVIAIGTPAQVRALLAKPDFSREPKGGVIRIEAVGDSLRQGPDQVDSEGGHHD